MSDPAIEAAQRAWSERYGREMLPRFLDKADDVDDIAAFVTASAREALKPVRDEHERWTRRYAKRFGVDAIMVKALLDDLAPLICTTEELAQ